LSVTADNPWARAFSMAIATPRRATTWPKPRSPSTTAIVGVSLSIAIFGRGFTSPAFIALT